MSSASQKSSSITNKQLFSLLTVNAPNQQNFKNVDMGVFEDNPDDDLSKMTVTGSRELDNFFKQSSSKKSSHSEKNCHSEVETPFTKSQKTKVSKNVSTKKIHPIVEGFSKVEITSPKATK